MKINDLEGEIWKDIIGWENCYMVSNKGRVKSLDRRVPHMNHTIGRKGTLLKLSYNATGYLTLRQFSLRTKGRKIFVHKLVAEAFIDNPENKKCVNHIDGVKDNNCLENLEWVTHSENIIHAKATGLQRKVGRSKITEDQAREIKIKLAAGEKMKSLAEQYNLAYVTIQGIKANARWGWVTI